METTTRKYRFAKGTPWRDRVIEGENGCLIWQGRLNRQGYGTWGTSTHPAGTLAHRRIYTDEIGPIPDGLTLDHLCRVTRCVNPAHLEPVSIRENLRRSPLTFQGRNIRKTHCSAGHAFDEANTHVNARGHRVCRACRRAYVARSRSERKAVA